MPGLMHLPGFDGACMQIIFCRCLLTRLQCSLTGLDHACLQITFLRRHVMRPQWSQRPAGSSPSSQPTMLQPTSQPRPSSCAALSSMLLSAVWGTTTSPTCRRWVDRRPLLGSWPAKPARRAFCVAADLAPCSAWPASGSLTCHIAKQAMLWQSSCGRATPQLDTSADASRSVGVL